jgi:hypothetical protein
MDPPGQVPVTSHVRAPVPRPPRRGPPCERLGGRTLHEDGRPAAAGPVSGSYYARAPPAGRPNRTPRDSVCACAPHTDTHTPLHASAERTNGGSGVRSAPALCLCRACVRGPRLDLWRRVRLPACARRRRRRAPRLLGLIAGPIAPGHTASSTSYLGGSIGCSTIRGARARPFACPWRRNRRSGQLGGWGGRDLRFVLLRARPRRPRPARPTQQYTTPSPSRQETLGSCQKPHCSLVLVVPTTRRGHRAQFPRMFTCQELRSSA